MFSGKTSELIAEYKRWSKINKEVQCINYAGDERYGKDDYAYSHDGSRIKCLKTYKLSDIPEEYLNSLDVILINEGQFFPDLIEFCKKWCEEKNKKIFVCALNGDFLRNPFDQISKLIPLCETIQKLDAFCIKCNDGTHASFTWRISTETEQVVIGAKNYLPVCRDCYLKLEEETTN
jgi:thymidine kinase